MTKNLPPPTDVKLMNATASLLFVVFAVLLVGTLVAWVSRHPAFTVRAIAVSGDSAHSNAVTVRANVASQLSGTFFTLDLERARVAFEALPWVRKAVVRREFPNRLKVVLQEHKAFAYWGPEGESRLLNNFGEVFEANVEEVEQADLPRLSGPEGQGPTVLAMYQALQPLFEGMDMALEKLNLTARGGWHVQLDSGAQFELGSGSAAEVLERTQRFLKTLTQVTSRYGRTPEALESADLRHEDGFSIRLRGVTTGVVAGQKK
jgi:cell division protein FtsQ